MHKFANSTVFVNNPNLSTGPAADYAFFLRDNLMTTQFTYCCLALGAGNAIVQLSPKAVLIVFVHIDRVFTN